jgi:methionyl-tRNA formyltransferase
MRLVFAGTPEFAATALSAIVTAGHEVRCVLTQPDRPSGRGMKLVPGAVKQRALSCAIPVWQPATLKDEAVQSRLGELFAPAESEVMIVAAYGMMLPQRVLDMPRLGCLNIHASLLPRWRGAAPIEHALIAGDTETGVCIMRMEAGLDTGPVLLARSLPIDARDTSGSLREKLGTLGAQTIVEVLAALAVHGRNAITAHPQPETGVTYAGKIRKTDAWLDFRMSVNDLDRRIRAFDPAPGAFGLLGGETIKIWGARPGARRRDPASPGSIVSANRDGIQIACGADGRDTLVVDELQKSGGKRLAAPRFLAGFPLAAGACLESPPAHS